MMTTCCILLCDARTPGSPDDEAIPPLPPHAQRVAATVIARARFGNEMQRTDLVLLKQVNGGAVSFAILLVLCAHA